MNGNNKGHALNKERGRIVRSDETQTDNKKTQEPPIKVLPPGSEVFYGFSPEQLEEMHKTMNIRGKK